MAASSLRSTPSEEHLRRSAAPAVILRPNFYMSNLISSAGTITELGQFFLPAADARLAMVDPRDVAAVAATILAREGDEGKVYELTGPDAITFSDVAAHLSTVVGRTVEYVAVPDEAAQAAMVGGGMPAWMADNLVTMFRLIRAGAADHPTGDVHAVTGRHPRSFAEFARDHASLFTPSPSR